MARLLATIRTRILRLLRRRGVLAAAVRGRSAFGDRVGTPVLCVGNAPDAPWVWTVGRRHAHLERFDLHADRAVGADDRAGLERLCRYLLPPTAVRARSVAF